MSRCIPMMVDEGNDQDQAVAMCSSMWTQDKSLDFVHSTFQIKSLDEKTRTFEGIATTPTTDRVGDIVDSLGGEFTLPVPLMWEHGLGFIKDPVGWVVSAKASAQNIVVRAEFAKLNEPPSLKNDLDRACALIKSGLVRGLSIKFKPIDAVRIKDTFGIHYKKWDWLELSAVAIPANTTATITAVKSADALTLALSGVTKRSTAQARSTVNPPAVAGLTRKSTMTTPEQITNLTNLRAAHVARMKELGDLTTKDGRTMTDVEGQEFDSLDGEIKSVDTQLERLRKLETLQKATAVPVTPETVQTATQGSQARSVIQVTSMVPKGIGFARAMIALAVCKGNRFHAAEEAKKQWPDMGTELEAVIKTEVLPGTTTGTTWAAPLIQSSARLVGEFIELLRPATIIGRIPNLRRVPFNVTVPVQSGGGTYGWVGEYQAKPVSALSLTTATLLYTKVAGIIPYTKEALRFSDPSIETVVRNDMITGVARFEDTQFVDPAVHNSAGVNPASITDQIIQVAASGTTATHFRNDFKNILGKMITNNEDPAGLVILMSASVAMNLASLMNSLGNAEFPTINMQGGSYMGIPIVVSQNVGARVILLDPAQILIAEDPSVTIDVSEEASVVMDTLPEASPRATSLVSFWQRNLIGLRVERFVTWKRAQTSAVEYIASAVYGG